MKSTDKLMDMLCQELDEIAEKGQLSAGDLDTVHKLIVSKEKLLRCEELEEDLGYSQDGGWRAEGAYRNGSARDAGISSRDNGMSYSNRGKHYVRAHYSRGRYSMADGRDNLIAQMHEIMDSGELSQDERAAVKRAVEKLENA